MTTDIFGAFSQYQPDLSSLGLSGFLGNSNWIIPLAAIAFLFIGRSLFGLTLGLLPILAIILLVLGSRGETFSAITANPLGEAITGSGAISTPSLDTQAWFLPALCILGLMFLLQWRILSIGTLLPLGIVLYLLFSGDFRIHTIAKRTSSLSLLTVLGIIAALLMLRWLFSSRPFSYGYRPPLFSMPRIKINWPSLKPVLVHFSSILGAVVGALMISNPPVLERSLPGWRETWGLAIFFVVLYCFGASLPPKFRPWLAPAFWLLIVLVIGFQVFLRASITASSAPTVPF